MKFARSAVAKLQDAGFESTDVGRVLRRLESTVPHLRFAPWSVRAVQSSDDETSEARWKDESRRTVEVRVSLESIDVTATCERDQGAVPVEDLRFLGQLAVEAEGVLRAAELGMVSLIDFGMAAIANELRMRANLRFNPLPIIQFIRSLGHETYENQPLSYGVILSGTSGGTAPFSEALDDKRFKRITDGISTALSLDGDGKVMDFVPLQVPAHEGVSARRRPFWSAGLAEAARERDGVGVALSREGDLLVVDRGRLVFSQRAGVWRAWNHSAIIGRLRSLWRFSGPSGQLSTVVSYLYQVAMDLAFGRSGGLLIVLGSRRRLPTVLASEADRISSAERSGPERALDRSLLQRSIHKADRRVVRDIASVDGALIVDRSGSILAYGAMVNLASSASQGARTRAALGASHHGLAIKIGADGDIAFYQAGKLRFEI